MATRLLNVFTVSALLSAAACIVDPGPADEDTDSVGYAITEATGGATASSSSATSGTGGSTPGGTGAGGTTAPHLCNACKASDETCECACTSEEKQRNTSYPTGNYKLVENVCWFNRTGCSCEEIWATERRVFREWHDGCGDSCDGGCGPAGDCVDDPGWTTIATSAGYPFPNCDIDWNSATCWTRCEGLDMLTSIGTTWASATKKTKTLYHVVVELCENFK
jgi:hypothetical protein